MTDVLLFLILVALLWAIFPPPPDRRVQITWDAVWGAVGIWLGLIALGLGAVLAIDWSIYGPPWLR